MVGDRPSNDLRGLYVPFSAGAYKLGARVNTDAFWASGRIAVHTDDLGLRSDADRHYGTKPGGTEDILVVGESGAVLMNTAPTTLTIVGVDG